MADLNSSQRPLMPYEWGLCQELGITEEEYRDFLDAVYSEMARKPMPGDAPQAGPVASLVIAIVGVLFQVVGLLLRPSSRQQESVSPGRPSEASPTFGFNSLQELVRLGTVVPLVYTDRLQNPNGGVRVATQLVWSQVESLGNTQLGKFVSVIGQGPIQAVDPLATGIGASLVPSTAATASWQYVVRNNGTTGTNSNGYLQQNPNPFLQTLPGIIQAGADPSPSFIVPQGASRTAGTSQAYSQANRATFGITTLIPLAMAVWTLTTDNQGNEFIDKSWNRIAVDPESAFYFQTPGAVLPPSPATLALGSWTGTLSGGSGYTNGTFSNIQLKSTPSSGRGGAIATITVSFGAVTAVSITSGGSGYQPGDVLTADATAVSGPLKLGPWSGGLLTGSGYVDGTFTNVPLISTPSLGGSTGGSGGVATITVTNGQVTTVEITSTGTGYKPGDVLTVETTSGTAPRSKALKTGITFSSFGDVLLGSGYKDGIYRNVPLVSKTGNGSGAVATIEVGGSPFFFKGAVSSIEITSGGSGYQSGDLLTVSNANLGRSGAGFQITVLEKAIVNNGSSNGAPGSLSGGSGFQLTVLLGSIRTTANPNVLTGGTGFSLTVDRNQIVINQNIIPSSAPSKAFNANQLNNYQLTISFEEWTLAQDLANEDAINRGVGDKVATRAAQQRTSITQSLNPAAAYVIGRTLWRYISPSPGENIDIRNGTVAARFLLTEAPLVAGALTSETSVTVTYTGAEAIGQIPLERRVAAQIEYGAYSSLAKVNALDFSIKARVWAEVSSPSRNDVTFNGDRPRTAFFSVRYRRPGDTFYTDIPTLFCITRDSKAEVYFYLRLEFSSSAESAENWEVQFFPVVDYVCLYTGTLYALDPKAPPQTVFNGSTRICFNGSIISGSSDYVHNNVFRFQRGWFSDSVYRPFQDARYSFEQGPEFEIVAVNEIQYDSKQSTYYNNLALLGLNIYGGKGRQDVSQITAFVTQGKLVTKQDTSQFVGPTCRFPDIFYDTLKSFSNNLVPDSLIDKDSLFQCNKFVEANKLWWDGVIDAEQSWRQWAATQAGFSLLQLMTRNGKLGLMPVVPYSTVSGAVDDTASGFTITALFNESNILSGSYTESIVPAEETTPQVITVKYREIPVSSASSQVPGFPRERTVSAYLNTFGSLNDKETVIDASGSVTTLSQAQKIATYLLTARYYENRTISFKTAEPWLNISPGSIIRVDTEFTNFNTSATGRVQADGSIDAYGYDGTQIKSGTAIIYRQDLGVQKLNVSGSLSASFAGSIIAIGNVTTENRLWTVTKVELDEDGLVTINAKLFPLNSSGGSLIASALKNPASYVTFS